jgi:hypothetical protein
VIRRRISAARNGDGCVLRLPAPERELLRTLPDELAPILAAFGSDNTEPPGGVPESMRRLFPPAYSKDDEAQRHYADLTRAELADHHRQALELLASTASATALDADEMQGWLTALNDLRLVLGTVLGVTEEDDIDEPIGSLSQQMIVYRYLSGLQAELLDVLEGTLPAPAPGADELLPDDPWGEPLGGLRWDGTPMPPWS